MTDKMISSQTAQHRNWTRKAESVEEWWACKANEAATKTAKVAVKVVAKTSQQVQTDQADKAMATSVSIGVTVINCKMGNSYQDRLSQVCTCLQWERIYRWHKLSNSCLPPAPVNPDIQMVKVPKQIICKTLEVWILEEQEDRSSDHARNYDSDTEVQHSESRASEDVLEKEDLIPNSSLCSLWLVLWWNLCCLSWRASRKLRVGRLSSGTWPELMSDAWGKWLPQTRLSTGHH